MNNWIKENWTISLVILWFIIIGIFATYISK